MFRGGHISMLLCSLIAVASCQEMPASKSEVVLIGYSDENYSSLDRAAGGAACIIGKLSVGTEGALFRLRPVVSESGVVNFGSSRVTVNWRNENSYANVKDDRTYRVCGELLSVETFKNCRDLDCKNYELRRSVVN